MTDHTTADDASRYRDPAAVSERWAADPIARLRTHLAEAGVWSKADEERLIETINGDIEGAVERYLKARPQPPEAMFDYLYAELPRALAEQRAAASAGEQHA
jgi:pyruvate dehydrogenase E1 component alpha subunit